MKPLKYAEWEDARKFFQSYREILKSHITIYDLWKWYVEIKGTVVICII